MVFEIWLSICLILLNLSMNGLENVDMCDIFKVFGEVILYLGFFVYGIWIRVVCFC